MLDKSHGYETSSEDFSGDQTLACWRDHSMSRVAVAFRFRKHRSDMGFGTYGVDASPTLLAKFRERSPQVPVECSPIEELSLSTAPSMRSWHAASFFLLALELQLVVIAKMASALDHGGHLLFTSPQQPCSWMDGMTDLQSLSLGTYVVEREANGLTLVGNDEDERRNHY
jgi:hypothetical protein